LLDRGKTEHSIDVKYIFLRLFETSISFCFWIHRSNFRFKRWTNYSFYYFYHLL